MHGNPDRLGSLSVSCGLIPSRRMAIARLVVARLHACKEIIFLAHKSIWSRNSYNALKPSNADICRPPEGRNMDSVTSQNLDQCWPRSMSPYGVTGGQWVNLYSHSITIRIRITNRTLITRSTSQKTASTPNRFTVRGLYLYLVG